MKPDEIKKAIDVYTDWLTETRYDKADVAIIRQALDRCLYLEKENLALRRQVSNLRKKEESRYMRDGWSE